MLEKYFLGVINGQRKSMDAFLLRQGLFFFSLVYLFCVSFLRFKAGIFQRSLTLPVISVGNVTWGGTGKTPFICMLLDYFEKQEKKVSVLMRGYGEDENRLIKGNFPNVNVLIGKDRYKAALDYLAVNVTDGFLLDDGFQQWALKKNVDIVMVNCLDPWGNGACIPRGSLREPFRSIKRADYVVLSNSDKVSTAVKESIKKVLLKYIDKIFVLEGVHKPDYIYKASSPEVHLNPNDFIGQKMVSFSGIGSPESFNAGLEKIGISIIKAFSFQDHYVYTWKDFEIIKAEIEKDSNIGVITTEKDLNRSKQDILREFDPYILKVKMELIGSCDGFYSRLDRLFSS